MGAYKHRLSNHKKPFKLEHYENDTELGNKTQPFRTKNHLKNNKAPFSTTKRKCYLSLSEKLEIALNKGDNLLKKGQNFLRSVARTKGYVFTETVLIGASVSACAVNVLHNMLFKTKIEQLKTTFS